MGDGFEHLTNKELRALKRLIATFQAIPPSLVCYVVDTAVVVCKKGLPSDDFSLTVSNGQFNPCAVLTDAHDDCDNGNS